MSFLLDTNIVSEARKGAGADVGGRRWLSSAEVDELYVSVLVVGEIQLGIELLWRREPTRSETLESWLRDLRRHHAERTLPITTEIAELWGKINAPDPLPTRDSLMAATAIVKNMTFVTRNTPDVERTGVWILNPFSFTSNS